jgi:predicted homoserine dehydrogenase-like protein
MLQELDSRNDPIRVGIVGMGAMGSGTLHMMRSTPGMVCAAAADLEVERAIAGWEGNGVPREEIVSSDRLSLCREAVRERRPVVSDDPLLIPELDLDVVVEATGAVDVGARVAYESLLRGTHVVMLTVEADVVVGPLLSRIAESAGAVYTLASGDQPGAIMELYHWADSLGLRVVAAGRGTVRYPEDRYREPEAEDPYRRNLISKNPKMINSFRDGTKAQIEMAAVSNATGLIPDVRGMHEPQVGEEELARVFSLREQGGVLGRKGVVELANAVNSEGIRVPVGQIGNGVFVVVESDHPGVQKYLRQSFPRCDHAAALVRPYHMTCLEVPVSIARAALHGCATAKPIGFFTETITVAKRDLPAGTVLDGGGGGTVYALVERADRAAAEDCLPIGFCEGAELLHEVSKDEVIRRSDVKAGDAGFLATLRKLQGITIGPIRSAP